LQKGQPVVPDGVKAPAAADEGDAVTSPPEDELCPESADAPSEE
jgi:hypothetical protein